MDQDGHQELPHGSLSYQNNSRTHANSVTTLSINYSNSGGHSHIQQQYGRNSSLSNQHCTPIQISDNSLYSSDISGSTSVPHASSISPQSVAYTSTNRSIAGQGTFMATKPCQNLPSHSETNKTPISQYYGANSTPATHGQVSLSSSYSQQSHSYNAQTPVSQLNSQPYYSPMTNSSTQSSATSSTTDPDKRDLIQQQLVLLLHAGLCRPEPLPSSPCTFPHCRTMRNVLQHMKDCSEGKNCRVPHCASSRQIISHWRNCNSQECPVCQPIRHNHQRASVQRQADQVPLVLPQPVVINGVSNNQAVVVNTRSPLTSTPRLVPQPPSSVSPGRLGVPQSQVAPSASGGGTDVSHSGDASIDPNDWRASVSVGQRKHVVRKIVKYILPKPDPAAYSDPRMINLMEYANKVENAMYTSARDRDEYFHLLSERCYKIYKELEDVRRRRRTAAHESSSGSASTIQNESEANIGAVVPSSTFLNHSADSQGPVSYALPQPNSTDVNSNQTPSTNKSIEVKREQENGVHSCDTMSLDAQTTGANIGSPGGSSTDAVKLDDAKCKKWSREELLRHFLPMHADVYNDVNAIWFRDPVDPVALDIPDYPEKITHPMDLTTIRNNLEDGVYKEPWEVLDHFRLMFNNAWLYNKKNSKVYKTCTKLSELFESRVDQVMQAMGYCCGHEYSYQQILYCSSLNVCTIGKDSFYYLYTNTDKKVLLCDNYYQCERCFNEAGDEIMLADEANQAAIPVRRELFQRMKNNVTISEPVVYCKECGRRWHKVCALHKNKIWPSGFTCPGCLRERGQKRKENHFTAKTLPTNRLSDFLEKRVNDFLKKKEVGGGNVTIRVLASSDKLVEVKPLMRGRFTESGELSDNFPYRLKAIFAFQEIDGQDVCFFGLYIQEYGSDSPHPNRRRVYVAYLDSVFYFRPKQYRTDVYHEILVGYLHYAKQMGFAMAHIWACPPGEGDDYIFHMHPIEQKIPKARRLQDWYRAMLKKAMIEGIVVDFKDILKDAVDNHLVSPTEIPYFEGDFWPNTLEEILQELNKEDERRRREELMAETEDDDAEVSRDRSSGLDVHDKRVGKKKAKKRKGSKKSGGHPINKRKKLDGPTDCLTELTRKVYDTMEKLKDIFFVIRLQRNLATPSLQPISDPDPLIASELMESRDSFLQMAREKHLEFSSLRRAKYSTMAMLYELHNEGRQSFLYTCNVCKAQIETRWHCTECDEYDLCTRCYRRENHPHQMEQFGLGIEEESSTTNGESSGDRPPGIVDRKASFEPCIKALVHACQCRDANCRIAICKKMKEVLGHARRCTKRASNTCQLCRQLLSICCFHAKSCQDDLCQVPLCPQLKDRFKQQQIQKRRQQNKSLQRRTNLTRGATGMETSLPAATGPTGAGTTYQPPQNYSSTATTKLESPHSGQISRNSSFAGSVDGSGRQVMHPSGSQTSINGAQRVIAASGQSTPAAVGTAQQQRLSVASSQPGWREAPLTAVSANAPSSSNPQSITQVTSSVYRQGAITNAGTPAASIGSLGANLHPRDNAEITPRATQPEIDRVLQVVTLIRGTRVSSEEQNKQFIAWIRRHPEFQPAFFALHDRKQNQRLAQQQQAQQSCSQAAQQQPQQASAGYGSQNSDSPITAVASSVAKPTPRQQILQQPVFYSAAGAAVSQSQLGDQASAPQQHQYVIAQPMRLRTLPGGQTVIQQSGQAGQQTHYQPVQQPQQQQQQQLPGNDQQWVFTRVRTMPGGPGQATQQPQQARQQVFTANNAQTTSAYGSTPTTSQHVITTAQPRLIPTGSVGQRVTSAGQSTTVVHFRAAPSSGPTQQQHQHQLGPQQALQQQQPHILLTNPSQASRPMVPQQQQPPASLIQQQLVKQQQQNPTS